MAGPINNGYRPPSHLTLVPAEASVSPGSGCFPDTLEPAACMAAALAPLTVDPVSEEAPSAADGEAHGPSVPAWYPGDEQQWKEFIQPVQGHPALQQLFNPAPRITVGQADFMVQEIVGAADWRDRVEQMEKRFAETAEQFHPAVGRRLNAVIDAALMTPEHEPPMVSPDLECFPDRPGQPFLVADLVRNGRPSVRVPTLTALLAGQIPQPSDGRTLFGEMLERMLALWFDASPCRMAKTLGMGTRKLLEIMLQRPATWRRPETYQEVKAMAERLGVDPNLFCIPWFADKQWPLASSRLILSDAATSQLRSRALIMMAVQRVEGKRWTVFRDDDDKVRKTIFLFFRCVDAGVHPQIALAVLADAAQGTWDFHLQAGRHAEVLAGHRMYWQAAVAAYLAAHHARKNRHLKDFLELVAQADRYLSQTRKVPAKLTERLIVRLRRRYLMQWVALDARMPRHVEITDPKTRLYVEMTLHELTQREVAAPAVRGEADEEQTQRMTEELPPENLADMTRARWELLEKLMRRHPSMWQQITGSKNPQLLHDVFRIVDPKRNKHAIAWLEFISHLYRVLEEARMLPAREPRRVEKDAWWIENRAGAVDPEGEEGNPDIAGDAAALRAKAPVGV